MSRERQVVYQEELMKKVWHLSTYQLVSLCTVSAVFGMNLWRLMVGVVTTERGDSRSVVISSGVYMLAMLILALGVIRRAQKQSIAGR